MYDVIIIGSGPAGLTAAIYTTRANLKTLVIAGGKWGGQLMLTTLVENYPGFPEGIDGPVLMENMKKQAEKHGAEILYQDFKKGDFSKAPFKIVTGEGEFEAKAVIIATGADTKWLDVPGGKEKVGGGGDSAMEEALVLTKFATSITLIHRGDSFRASEIMQKRVKEESKIKI